MKILFFGVIASEKFISKLVTEGIGNPNLAAQKYHRLLLEGIALNGIDVEVIVMPELNVNKVYRQESESINLIDYNYLDFYPLKFIKISMNVFKAIFYVIKWKFRNMNSKHYIMFDSLHLTSSLTSIILSRFLNIKSITTVTDLPKFMYIFNEYVGLKETIVYQFKDFLIKKSDILIALTEPTIKYFTNYQGKAIVIEGLVDVTNLDDFEDITISQKKILHYSGGLFEKFGVKQLIDAFMLIKGDNLELHLYGSGDLIEFINNSIVQDKRIKYFGIRDNSIILSEQKKSFLLINPRFSTDEFTNYSFPSKTIEYLASGRPVLSNRLPGIPVEYFDHLYCFEDQSLNGFIITIKKMLLLSPDELFKSGEAGKKYVMLNKNKTVQALRLSNILFS